MDIKLRVVGNAFTMLGYFTLLHVDPLIGSSIKIVGFILTIPFVFRMKYYDFLVLIGFFGLMDISNVIKLLIF